MGEIDLEPQQARDTVVLAVHGIAVYVVDIPDAEQRAHRVPEGQSIHQTASPCVPGAGHTSGRILGPGAGPGALECEVPRQKDAQKAAGAP